MERSGNCSAIGLCVLAIDTRGPPGTDSGQTKLSVWIDCSSVGNIYSVHACGRRLPPGLVRGRRCLQAASSVSSSLEVIVDKADIDCLPSAHSLIQVAAQGLLNVKVALDPCTRLHCYASHAMHPALSL